jgi:glycosyltransferase involved in cell wall biosynthesis
MSDRGEGALGLLALGPCPPPVNGMSQAFDILVRGLPTRGFELDVVDLADRTVRQGRSFTWQRARDAAQAWGKTVARVKGKDLVYLTLSQSRWGFAKDLGLLLAARTARVPAVVHLHGGSFRQFMASEPPAVRAAMRKALQPVAGFIVLGELLRDQFELIPGADAKTVVIPNPSDQPVEKPRPSLNKRLRMLFLSNLHPAKGYRELLDARTELRAALPDWELELHFAGAFLAGEGLGTARETEEDFHRRAAEVPGIPVRWHGVLRGEQKRALFEGCDVFVLPTYYGPEGQPISVLEALCHGLPVVSTRYRGIPEVLPEPMQALHVEPRSPSSIARSLVRLVTEPGLYEALSEAAVRQAVRFSPETHVDSVAGFLTRVVRDARSASNQK